MNEQSNDSITQKLLSGMIGTEEKKQTLVYKKEKGRKFGVENETEEKMFDDSRCIEDSECPQNAFCLFVVHLLILFSYNFIVYIISSTHIPSRNDGQCESPSTSTSSPSSSPHPLTHTSSSLSRLLLGRCVVPPSDCPVPLSPSAKRSAAVCGCDGIVYPTRCHALMGRTSVQNRGNCTRDTVY